MHRSVLLNSVKGRQNDKYADIIKRMTYSWFMRIFYNAAEKTINRNVQIVQSYLFFVFIWMAYFLVKREKNPF